MRRKIKFMSRVIASTTLVIAKGVRNKHPAKARGQTYLTTEVLGRAVNRGIRQASINAMKTAGSVVTVHEGWVVRKGRDGSVAKIKKLPIISVADINKKTAKLAFK
jgi:hypothetical protein